MLKPRFSTPFTMIELLDKGHHLALEGNPRRLYLLRRELAIHYGLTCSDDELRDRLCTCEQCRVAGEMPAR